MQGNEQILKHPVEYSMKKAKKCKENIGLSHKKKGLTEMHAAKRTYILSAPPSGS